MNNFFAEHLRAIASENNEKFSFFPTDKENFTIPDLVRFSSD